jgi:hypothetical protein
MASRLDWHGDAVAARIRSELSRRLSRCCLLVVDRAKGLLNVDGTGTRKGRKKRGKDGRYRKAGKGGLAYGANPSKAGEAPRKQRGRLLGSVAWELVGLAGRVGTNLPYGRWLELGTRLTAARPWLRVALRDCRDAIVRILSAPMKGP